MKNQITGFDAILDSLVIEIDTKKGEGGDSFSRSSVFEGSFLRAL